MTTVPPPLRIFSAGVLFPALCLVLAAAPARAASITLTSVDFGTSSSAFEGDGSFVSFSGSNLVVGHGTGGLRSRAIVEFDISGIDVGWTLTNATFFLTDEGGASGQMGSAGTAVPRWGYAGDGVVQLGDEDTGGATGLSDLLTTGSGGSTYGVNVLALINSFVGASENYAGFIVEENDSDLGFMNFLLPGSGSTEPRLVIQYDEAPGPAPVPEPSSLLLLGTGGLLAVAVRRWRAARN
jgi:hypothetical protein